MYQPKENWTQMDKTLTEEARAKSNIEQVPRHLASIRTEEWG